MFEKIALAKTSDAPEIGRLFRAVTAAMEARGIDQWNDWYPLEKDAVSDIEKECLFVYNVDGAIAGVVSLNAEQEAVYQTIIWRVNKGKALIVHRLAVHPSYQHQGIAKTLMRFAEVYGQKEDYQSIRLDTYSRNPYSLALYAKLGYEKKEGIVHFPGRAYHFFCFEKAL